MHILAVNKKGINILGATILRFSGKSKSGTTLKTRQITCVKSDSERLSLSWETCKALGIIYVKFPTVGEVSLLTTQPPPDTSAGEANTVPAETPQSTFTAGCNCMRCQTPPPQPTQPPFPSERSHPSFPTTVVFTQLCC